MKYIKESFRDKTDIKKIFRLLWLQNVEWMRMYMISLKADLPDLGAVRKRLLKNPIDFSYELKKYYGGEKAKAFEELLTQNIIIYEQLAIGIKKNDITAADKSRRKWYENADEIAERITNINMYYSQDEWRVMLYDHLFMTENEIKYRFEGRHEQDIEEYDNIKSQAIRMADMMSRGITEQFKLAEQYV